MIDVYERNLKFVLRRLRKYASLLEDKGYEGMHASFKGKLPHHNVTFRGDTPPSSGWRFHDEYLWTTTLALREGCKIGDEIGADPNLLKEVRTLADVLDMALERKYAGMKAEGENLMDWGRKQLRPQSGPLWGARDPQEDEDHGDREDGGYGGAGGPPSILEEASFARQQPSQGFIEITYKPQ